jgi:hypothetical protein
VAADWKDTQHSGGRLEGHSAQWRQTGRTLSTVAADWKDTQHSGGRLEGHSAQWRQTGRTLSTVGADWKLLQYNATCVQNFMWKTLRQETRSKCGWNHNTKW